MSRIPDPWKMKRIKGPALSQKELESTRIRIIKTLDKETLKNLASRIARLERAVFKRKAA